MMEVLACSYSIRTMRFLAVLLTFSLPAVTWGLALVSPPQAAGPVIFGTSEYSNLLYGKIQRAASLYGTNLAEPFAVLSPPLDSEKKLDKVLWNKFSMATSGTSGYLEEADVLRKLSSWIPQADLKDTLIFIDATTPLSSGGGGDNGGGLFGFFQNKSPSPVTKNGGSGVSTVKGEGRINIDLLQCAVERKCAHIYVLSDDVSLASCVSTLEEHAGSIPSTVLALDEGVTLEVTNGWTSSRPQDMEGELTGPVALREYDAEETKSFRSLANSSAAPVTFPAEDAAEIMLQVSLRTDRSSTGSSFRKIVRLSNTVGNGSGGGGGGAEQLEERLNADYFTLLGGRKARARAGTVQSVKSWGSVLSPFGPVITNLCERPDRP